MERSNRPERAASEKKVAAAADLGDAREHLRHGLAHHQAGNFAAALADYGKALAAQPDLAEAYNNRAAVHYAGGDFAAALADCDAALSHKPAYPEAYHNRGAVRLALNDPAGAVADLDRAIGLNPGYAEAYRQRALARRTLQDYAGAVEDLTRALLLRPTDVGFYEDRADTYYLQWNHGAAAADYDRVLSLLGGAPTVQERRCRALVYRGDARYHNGEPEGMIADYREAFRLDRDRAAGFIVARLARDLAGNRSAVFANCLRHLRARPGDGLTHGRRGLAYLLEGREAEAQEDFARFLAQFPDGREAFEAVFAAATALREAASGGSGVAAGGA